MGYFTHITTRDDGSGSPEGFESFVTHVTGLALVEVGGELLVYTSSGRDGGVLARGLSGGTAGGMAARDAETFTDELLDVLGTGAPEASADPVGEAFGLWAPTALTATVLDGQTVLLLHGAYDDVLTGYHVAGDGTLSGRFELDLGSQAGALTAVTGITLSGREMLYTASRHDWGIRAWEGAEAGDAALTARGQAQLGETQLRGDIYAMEAALVGGEPFLFAASARGNIFQSYAIAPDGSLTQVAGLDFSGGDTGATTGLTTGLSGATTLEIVELGGASFALLGAAGSSSITVMALGADGTMAVTDQVIDSRDTRFQSLTQLETVVLGERAYVIAAGADDGLTLLELTANGRLRHLETIEDDLTMALGNASALTTLANPETGGITLVVAGQGENAEGYTALSHFEIDPTPDADSDGGAGLLRTAGAEGGALSGEAGADQLIGGAGADQIAGGAGADYIFDGAGADVLTGGAGADTFVFTADGTDDRVTDFELGRDRLDISDLGFERTVDDVTIIATATGAELHFAGERVILESADGGTLSPGAFTTEDLFDGADHVAVDPVPLGDQVLMGTDVSEALSGSAGDDLIVGGGGADTLAGGGGDDRILGERADAAFDEAAGQVLRLYEATLGRAPDADGHFGWTRILLDGTLDLLSVVDGFTGSVEFEATYGATSDADFVVLLYQNVLGRAPDDAGLQGWLSLLEGGLSRAEVVLGFSESAEFRIATEVEALGYGWAATQGDWLDDVYRLYQATLGRAPDAAGLSAWTALLTDGLSFETVVAGFVGSAEFTETYGATTTADFVTLLYANVLGRAPDAEGFAAWTGAIDGGAVSREQAVEGFAQSAEFVTATVGDIFDWVRAEGADDEIVGGGGDDLAVGGLFSDTFILAPSEAAPSCVTIADLERWDRLSFEGFGYGAAADVRAHLRQEGADVVFEDQGAMAILPGMTLAEVEDDLFLF